MGAGEHAAAMDAPARDSELANGTHAAFKQLLAENNFNTVDLRDMLSRYGGVIDPDAEYAFDIVVENQRGLKLFGVAHYSHKSLFPVIDPPPYQRLDGLTVLLNYNSISNYPLPDLGWLWAWEQWYVLMLNDVDESGWVYLFMFAKWSRWHGKYYWGDYVRRRLWVRMRIRKGA